MCERVLVRTLLASIVRATLCQAIGDAKTTDLVLTKAGVTVDGVVEMIINRMAKRANADIQVCVDILSNNYCDNFDPSCCIVYRARPPSNSFPRSNAHCGKEISTNGVCSKCSTTTEGKKVIATIENGSMNPAAYRAKKTASRKTMAKRKLRCSDIDHYFLGDKLFVSTGREGVYECPEIGITCRRIYINGVAKTLTLGQGKDCEKLSYTSLVKLKDVPISVDVSSLSPECTKIIESKVN